MLADPERARSAHAVKRQLGDRDWQEVVTFTFVNSAWETALFPGRAEAEAPIKVLNPIASHLDVMRTTFAGGLIDVLVTNLARRADRVRIFESGRCFLRSAEGCDQPLRLGGLAYGDALPLQWGASARAVDIFDVKGDLAALVAPRVLTTERASHPSLHPGRAARVLVDGVAIGWLGELHPRLMRHFDLPRAPVLFELELAPLLGRPMPSAKTVSRLPLVRRDLALVVSDEVPAQNVLAAMEAADVPRVEAIRLFDVYRGPGIAPGKKSLAILVLIRDTERTLTDPEIDEATAKVAASRRRTILRHASPVGPHDADQSRTRRLAIRATRSQQARSKGHGRALFRGNPDRARSGRQRQALGIRQLPVARKAAAPRPKSENR
jgi:phenylalanyl-tRNA synthetase beta chain